MIAFGVDVEFLGCLQAFTWSYTRNISLTRSASTRCVSGRIPCAQEQGIVSIRAGNIRERSGNLRGCIHIPRHEDAAFALPSARLASSSLASITRVMNEGSFIARLASMASPRLLNIAPLWSSSSSATSNGAIRAA